MLRVLLNSNIAVLTEDLSEEIGRLSSLSESLIKADGTLEKIEVLNSDSRVTSFAFPPAWKSDFSIEEELAIKSVIAIGQYSSAFELGNLSEDEVHAKSKQLLESLLLMEMFYKEIGGIVGYQQTLLQFLHRPKQRFLVDKSRYLSPAGIDLSIPSLNVDEMIYHSIDKMDQLAEMYPVGGAADRLRLQDPETGTLIPAAMLSFNGRTLLGKLIEDLQAREYFYFKIKNKQIVLPVAMMTSKEKDNHEQIIRLCEKNNWFLRPKEKFSFFSQPLVPVVSREGNWIVTSPLTLLTKPGGHGVIWKLARDRGVIDWLAKQGAQKAIIRQINNPISSEDYHLMAFSGYGLQENKKFGFASCERQVKASEGINVLVEEEKDEGFVYTLTNIEYCDFQAYSIQDEPAEKGGRFSKFPSNTNLLFVDLASISEAVQKHPLPGMLVNVKKVVVRSEDGEESEEEVARLESTMQNVADYFQKKSKSRLDSQECSDMDSYITFNKRQKTISTTKKEFSLGNSLLETPEGCFLDVLTNMRDLLENYCNFQLPILKGKVENFTSPSFLFHYHGSLGPIYSVIAKKLRSGRIDEKSELRLDITECDIENLSVAGSLLIDAERIMGEVDEQGVLRYSNRVGRCSLKNVSIKNQGIDFNKPNVFWKPTIYRAESCRISLQGASEFHAENVVFEGDFEIVIENGYRVTAHQSDKWVIFVKEKTENPSWIWSYKFDDKKALQIEKICV